MWDVTGVRRHGERIPMGYEPFAIDDIIFCRRPITEAFAKTQVEHNQPKLLVPAKKPPAKP